MAFIGSVIVFILIHIPYVDILAQGVVFNLRNVSLAWSKLHE